MLNIFQIDMLLFIGNPFETAKTKTDLTVSNFPYFILESLAEVFTEMYSNSKLNISIAISLKVSLYITAVFLYRVT